MKNILSWYHPLSKRSENFDNFWRQTIFIAALFLLAFCIWNLEKSVFDMIRDYYIKNNGTYERKIASSISMIFSLTGAILWFYASWLICWSSKQQMKAQGFTKAPEIIMWIILALQAYASTKTSYFSSFTISLPLASIFTFYLLLNGFLKSKGVNIDLIRRLKGIFKFLPIIGKNLKKAAGSISKEQ